MDQQYEHSVSLSLEQVPDSSLGTDGTGFFLDFRREAVGGAMVDTLDGGGGGVSLMDRMIVEHPSSPLPPPEMVDEPLAVMLMDELYKAVVVLVCFTISTMRMMNLLKRATSTGKVFQS